MQPLSGQDGLGKNEIAQRETCGHRTGYPNRAFSTEDMRSSSMFVAG